MEDNLKKNGRRRQKKMAAAEVDLTDYKKEKKDNSENENLQMNEKTLIDSDWIQNYNSYQINTEYNVCEQSFKIVYICKCTMYM